MIETNLNIELYIARHGQTAMNLDRSVIGGRNVQTELDDQGIQQAITLGENLGRIGLQPDLIFSSPAIRALQTAEYCLQAMGCELRPEVDERLHEMSQGSWEGRSRAEIYTEAQVAKILSAPETFRAPRGESMVHVAARQLSFVEEMVHRAEEAEQQPLVALAFGHGLATLILAGTYLGWSVDTMRQDQRTPNASLSLFTYNQEDWQVAFIGKDAATLTA